MRPIAILWCPSLVTRSSSPCNTNTRRVQRSGDRFAGCIYISLISRAGAGCISRSDGIVHFLLPGFPATHPLNHNHPQLGGSTPTDGAVKGLLRLGNIGPHGGLAGA